MDPTEELSTAMERKRRNRDMDEEEKDRVSNLPEFLMHQILSYLPPKEAARTSVLSKTWLQSYSTSPFLSFSERFFPRSDTMENRYPFFDFVNNTLLRYTRQNLRIHKLQISVFRVNHGPVSRLLDESLRIAFDGGVRDLNISVSDVSTSLSSHYTLPSAMFDSPKLFTSLCLCKCKFPENIVSNFKCNAINFPVLKSLTLFRSHINDSMLQKLLSICPSIEKIIFFEVSGFAKFRAAKLGKLRRLEIIDTEAIVIDVQDAPRLHSLTINSHGDERPCFLKLGSSLQSQNLKRLVLHSVSISDDSLKDLITKTPLLEYLQIIACDGLKRVYILSTSLKYLDFDGCKMLLETIIDAPNLLEIWYNGENMLSLSLNITPNKLQIFISIYYFDFDHRNNAWFNQLRKLLKEVNQTRVHFRISSFDQVIDFGMAHNYRENPLPLEHRTGNFTKHINQSSSFFAIFVETLFSSSHPATIDTPLPGLYMSEYVEFEKFLSNELMTTTRYLDCCSYNQTKCWRHYLKDVKVEVIDSPEVWQTLLLEETSQRIHFSLKWYDDLKAD